MKKRVLLVVSGSARYPSVVPRSLLTPYTLHSPFIAAITPSSFWCRDAAVVDVVTVSWS